MDDEDYEEWLTDFGARGFTLEDLERLLAKSRQVKDEDLRRLVKSHMYLRHLVRDFLLPLATFSPESLNKAQLSMIETIRRLVDDEGQAK